MSSHAHNTYPHSQRSVAEVLNDFKEELKDFATTRIQMFRSELNDKVGAWKMALPSIAIGAVLLFGAFLLFTGLLVAVIALAFGGHMWAYAASFAIVMVLYGAAGGAALAYGVRTVKARGLAPERTLRVLKQDQVWLQTEARTQV